MEFLVEYGVLKKTVGPNDRVIIVPEGIRKIENFALRFTSPVDEIIFPASLREMEANAIYNYTKIKGIPVKRLRFKEGLEILQNGAISMDAVEEVYLPRSLKYVGTGNFGYSNTLRYVSFADPYGWYYTGASGVYTRIPFSLSDPYANAEYYRHIRNPQGVYGLEFYYLKKY